jgi:hypothetical protein
VRVRSRLRFKMVGEEQGKSVKVSSQTLTICIALCELPMALLKCASSVTVHNCTGYTRLGSCLWRPCETPLFSLGSSFAQDFPHASDKLELSASHAEARPDLARPCGGHANLLGCRSLCSVGCAHEERVAPRESRVGSKIEKSCGQRAHDWIVPSLMRHREGSGADGRVRPLECLSGRHVGCCSRYHRPHRWRGSQGPHCGSLHLTLRVTPAIRTSSRIR